MKNFFHRKNERKWYALWLTECARKEVERVQQDFDIIITENPDEEEVTVCLGPPNIMDCGFEDEQSRMRWVIGSAVCSAAATAIWLGES